MATTRFAATSRPKIQDSVTDQNERQRLLAQLWMPDRGQSLADLRQQSGPAGPSASMRSLKPLSNPMNAQMPSIGVNPPAPNVNSDGIQKMLDAAVVSNPSQAQAAEQAAAKQVSAGIASSAGTGKAVATPYGTVASRNAPGEGGMEPVIPLNGPAQGPTQGGAPIADTGPQRAAPLTWDQQVVKMNQQIGVLDSPENKAFVAAHKAALAGGHNGQPYDPAKHGIELAKAAMAQIKNDSYANEALANSLFDPTAKLPTNPTPLEGAPRVNLGKSGISLPQASTKGGTAIGGGVSIGLPPASMTPAQSTLFANGGTITADGPTIMPRAETNRALAGMKMPALTPSSADPMNPANAPAQLAPAAPRTPAAPKPQLPAPAQPQMVGGGYVTQPPAAPKPAPPPNAAVTPQMVGAGYNVTPPPQQTPKIETEEEKRRKRTASNPMSAPAL